MITTGCYLTPLFTDAHILDLPMEDTLSDCNDGHFQDDRSLWKAPFIQCSILSRRGISVDDSSNTSGIENGGDNGDGSSVDAQKVFENFLERHKCEIMSISQEEVTPEVLLEGLGCSLEFTKFVAMHDTLMYSQMIEVILTCNLPSSSARFIDLCAGSSVPTIRALLRNPAYKDLTVVSVDVDADAITISRRNVALAGLQSRFIIMQSDMLAYLDNVSIGENEILVSNPPYMPIPATAKSDFFLPVDGGADGTKYLEQILTKDMPAGSIVGIRWCSLTNPVRLVKLIEDRFDVVDVRAHRAPFGTYAKMTQEYLQKQREAGKSVFYQDAAGNKNFVFMSTVLRRKEG